MKSRKRIKYYRWLFALVVIPGLLLVIGGLAKVLAYFNEGANRLDALNLPAPDAAFHVPRVSWLTSAPAGRQLDDYNRHLISEEYCKAWYFRHLANCTGDTLGLRDFYTREARQLLQYEVRQAIDPAYHFQQTDLEHHLALHYFSGDAQLVAFSDRQVVQARRIYDATTGASIATFSDTLDYDVVMILLDGHWRIKLLEAQATRQVLSNDTIPVTRDSLVTVQGRQFLLYGQPFLPVGVNYYPAETPWHQFWPLFDSTVTHRDFSRIRSLGFNTVRIFIGFDDFNKGQTGPHHIARLQQLLDLAHRHQLKVIVTLFDFLGDYQLLNYPATDRQLEYLLTAFRQHPALLAWDLKNEPDLDFHHHPQNDVQDWLAYIMRQARRYDPNHLLTIGWSQAPAAQHLQEAVDFVSFHAYGAPDSLDHQLQALLKAVGNKPVMLEEFGLSTYRGWWSPRGHSVADQADYFRRIRSMLRRHGNLPYLVWTLYDFTDVPPSVAGRLPWRRNPQKHFGILYNNGKEKPGAIVLRP